MVSDSIVRALACPHPCNPLQTPLRAIAGTLRIFSVVPDTSTNGLVKPSMEYVLHADDGRILNLDMSQVPGVGIGPASATRCVPFTIDTASASPNSLDSPSDPSASPSALPLGSISALSAAASGLSCEADTDPKLIEQLRQPGARIAVSVQQTLSAARAQGATAARSASAVASILGDERVTATSLRVLHPPAIPAAAADTSLVSDSDPSPLADNSADDAADSANGTRRQLSVTRRPINLLYAIITACGQPATISANDLRTVTLPLYNDWFRSASYGRASLDPRSTAEIVDVPCSAATTCRASKDDGAEDVIAAHAKRLTNYAARGFTNIIIAMPPAWERACNPSWGGLGLIGRDTTWVRSYNYALNLPTTGLHELLHNFRLAHANGPTNVEYADTSCIMSSYYPPERRTVLYPNGPHQWQLGWADIMEDVNLRTLSATRTFTLPASTRTSSPANLLRLTSPSTNYYLQLRSRDARLDNLPATFDQSVVIQRFTGDQDAVVGTNYVGSLGSGQSMTIEGVTISVSAVGGGTARVTVARGSGNPTPTPTPTPTPVASGWFAALQLGICTGCVCCSPQYAGRSSTTAAPLIGCRPAVHDVWR